MSKNTMSKNTMSKNTTSKTLLGLFVALLLALALLTLASAQEEGLYAPAPPADAAFVRILHAVPDAPALSASIDDVAYGDVAFSQASPYRVITQGERTLSAGETSEALTVGAGKFYTVALTPGGVVVNEDPSSSNRAKALLIIYNLSDIASVDLKTADGKTEVLMATAPNAQQSIEVNGITVDLAVSSSGTELQAFPGVSLERGSAYSVFVLGTSSAPTVVWVQSETTTE